MKTLLAILILLLVIFATSCGKKTPINVSPTPIDSISKVYIDGELYLRDKGSDEHNYLIRQGGSTYFSMHSPDCIKCLKRDSVHFSRIIRY